MNNDNIPRDLRGRVIAPYELPPPDTKRWHPKMKVIVVRFIQADLLTREDALMRYNLSDEELSSWERGIGDETRVGLFATRQHPDRRKKK